MKLIGTLAVVLATVGISACGSSGYTPTANEVANVQIKTDPQVVRELCGERDALRYVGATPAQAYQGTLKGWVQVYGKPANQPSAKDVFAVLMTHCDDLP